MGRQPRGRRGDSPCDAFRTAEGTRGASRGPFSNARERGLGSKSQIPVYTAYAPTVEEWNLRTEPWIFVVDAHGLIRTRFEGLTTRSELEAVLKSMLRPD
jgi:hypothetical protein